MRRQETMLRLKRFKVEELARRLVTLDGMRMDLERKLADLQDTIARERHRANDSDIGRLAFPSFLRSIDTRREKINDSLKEISRERAQCDLELSTGRDELKSLEVAAEQETRRLAEAEARRSQTRLDEMALVRHLRKHALRGT
ncbi:MAG TPA: flagellar FliJ family protein [Rhizomicrobium sp.]|nr:flagellar FliJ family protein [Rhizomicrobium sp.]